MRLMNDKVCLLVVVRANGDDFVSVSVKLITFL